MSSFNTLDSAGPVRSPLDQASLLAYLRREGLLPPGLQQERTAKSSPGLEVQQFAHGQSNPTYLVTLSCGPGVPPMRMVLRKKPVGKILPSAHAVEREYAVIVALHGSGNSSSRIVGRSVAVEVPVPRPLRLCEDTSVLGTPFYLMDFAEGTVFLDPNLPGISPQARHHIYRQMALTLAQLHGVNPVEAGLSTYGSATNYCSRQVRRWSQQYRSSIAAPTGEVVDLVAWLESHVPPDDSRPHRPVVCHGDYRLDNLVLDNMHHQVKAVLDWELSTLGNPWADLAYNCLPYHLPPGSGLPALSHRPQLPDGIPSEAEYMGWYCAAAGLEPPSAQDWAFYLALSLFRLLSILAGVQARSRLGNASSASAAAVASDQVLMDLAKAALGIIAKASQAVPSHPASPSPPGRMLHSPSAQQATHQVGGALAGTSATWTSSHTSGAGAGCGGFHVDGLSPKVQALRTQLLDFMERHVYPAEATFEEHAAGPSRWSVPPLMERLKQEARACGLWNLWLPGHLAAGLAALLAECPEQERVTLLGPRLNNLEYAHLCEITGRSPWAPEVFNCGAPDTGNMEVLAKYGSRQQQSTWLLPLLRGEIRSCFAMTEKAVASSDATNIQGSIVREGDSYRLNGLKWWTSGACDPRCRVAIFMGKTDMSAPPHQQQSMVLVPMDSPGVRVVRPMLVYGFDDAPHGHAEVDFSNVLVPASDSLLLGEGRGFEIAQGRLGPGRLHHCMRLVGMAERGIELMARRALDRRVFGGAISDQGGFKVELAKARIDIDGARLMVLAAASALDREGFKGAKGPIAAAKVAAPHAALRVLDAAIQVHGGAGVSQDTILARLWTHARTLRIADGPDEVHSGTLAKLELSKYSKGRQGMSKL